MHHLAFMMHRPHKKSAANAAFLYVRDTPGSLDIFAASSAFFNRQKAAGNRCACLGRD